jgi:hypothetical protein
MFPGESTWGVDVGENGNLDIVRSINTQTASATVEVGDREDTGEGRSALGTQRLMKRTGFER